MDFCKAKMLMLPFEWNIILRNEYLILNKDVVNNLIALIIVNNIYRLFCSLINND